MNWGEKKLLLKKPLLIDGLSRSGKSILSGIVPSLKNSEQIKVFTYFEHLLPGLEFKQIKSNFAEKQLCLMLNEIAYNTFIGRDGNTRSNDYTGLMNKKHKEIFLNRLKSKEGETVVKKLIKTNNFFPFMTHELMPNLKFLNKLNFNLKVIEVYRNPIDNVYSWIKKKVIKNFINDPRSFTLTLKSNKNTVPWFSYQQKSKWSGLNEYEKCTISVINLIERSIKSQKNIKKNKILTISFEDFYQNPDKNILNICKFINTRPSKHTKSEIKKANCPRIDNLKNRNEKLKFIKRRVSRSLFSKLINLKKYYERNLYNLK